MVFTKRIFFIFILIFCFTGFTIKSQFINVSDLNVSVKCDTFWKLPKTKAIQYEYSNLRIGDNGFMYVDSYRDYEDQFNKQDEIDKLVQTFIQKNDTDFPYGKNPIITKLKIQGQDARLIIPSKDQLQNDYLENKAAIIVKYPFKIEAFSPHSSELNQNNKKVYTFLKLVSDKNHIEEIAKTIKFYRTEPYIKACYL